MKLGDHQEWAARAAGVEHVIVNDAYIQNESPPHVIAAIRPSWRRRADEALTDAPGVRGARALDRPACLLYLTHRLINYMVQYT